MILIADCRQEAKFDGFGLLCTTIAKLALDYKVSQTMDLIYLKERGLISIDKENIIHINYNINLKLLYLNTCF